MVSESEDSGISLALTQESPRAALRRAIDAMKAGKPGDAEAICREQLDEHPGNVEQLRLLGHSLMAQRRFDEAEQTLRTAIDLAPDYPD